jgi:hypothetical protein
VLLTVHFALCTAHFSRALALISTSSVRDVQTLQNNFIFTSGYKKIELKECQDCTRVDKATCNSETTTAQTTSTTTAPTTTPTTAPTTTTTAAPSTQTTIITSPHTTTNTSEIPSKTNTIQPITQALTSLTLTPSNICNSTYPEGCSRPVTWETTAKGETRDFFKILKQRYGRRANLMRDTTHWPTRTYFYNKKIKRSKFLYGRLNDMKTPYDF